MSQDCRVDSGLSLHSPPGLPDDALAARPIQALGGRESARITHLERWQQRSELVVMEEKIGVVAELQRGDVGIEAEPAPVKWRFPVAPAPEVQFIFDVDDEAMRISGQTLTWAHGSLSFPVCSPVFLFLDPMRSFAIGMLV